MTTIDLDALKRLAEAATPGPWHSDGRRVIHLAEIGLSHAVELRDADTGLLDRAGVR
jgi:hypothetical protein